MDTIIDRLCRLEKLVLKLLSECLPAKTITFFQRKEITVLEMTDTQQADVSLEIKDKKGNPASVDGIPVWESSDTNVATVNNIATDGMAATVVGVAVGVCQIKVTADADLGEGIAPLIGFLDVNIKGGQATVIELTASAPVEQP